MAVLTGALFSLAASGTIADTLTFAKWKGIQYVRTRVIPANPQSAAQQAVRGTFITLNEMWKRMPTLGRQPYAAFAAGLPLTDRNKHIQENVVPLRDDASLQNYVWSVAGGQAVPFDTFVAVGGVGNIHVESLTVPTAPVGYTWHSYVMAALLFGDPSTPGGIVRTMVAEEELNPAVMINFNVSPAGNYWTGGWIKWTRDSDSRIFYSTALINGVAVT